MDSAQPTIAETQADTANLNRVQELFTEHLHQTRMVGINAKDDYTYIYMEQ